MGKIDDQTQIYMSDKNRFADAFNFYLYGGEQVIRADDLKPMDSREIIALYGKHATASVTRYRDELKQWRVMEDEENCYVVLGIENQATVHYAEPVAVMLYDALQYAMQVQDIGKSYKDNAWETKSGEKLSKGAFLYGFSKEDRLKPVITLVIYFGDQKWDGPLSIHEMLALGRKELLQFVPDYRIHLLTPSLIEDDEFVKFNTGLGQVFEFIKHSVSKEKLREHVINNDRFLKVDPESARLLEAVTGYAIRNDEMEGTMNMCKGLEELFEEGKEEGIKEGVKNTLAEQVRKKIKRNKSFDQIVDECEATAEEIRPLYDSVMAQMQTAPI